MDQVDEVKQKTDIVQLVGAYVALKKAGRHHKGLCPFHAEKTPSFNVNEELGLYKCFGCGVGGDAIKFLMEIEGIDFVEALKRLAERAGVKIEFKNDGQTDERKELLEVMDLASRYYHFLLTEHKEGEAAKAYLEERKINKKLIETFNLGFALPSWDGLVNYLVKKKGYKEELLEKAGLVVKRAGGSGYYDKFRGRIMFPLQDAAGKVVGFSGRILPELAKEGEAKYMNSPETEIYHKGKMLYGFYQAKQAIREKKQTVIVEGMLDLISSYGAGVTESVAVGGTALTPEQVEMLARLGDKVVLAMDADSAGEAAIKRSVEVAEKRGLNIKVVHIVGGKDPDEIARNKPSLWKEMVEKAVSIYEFVLKKAIDKYPKGNEDRVRNVAMEVIPFLAKIDQDMVRDKWAKVMADSLEVDKDSVLSEIRKYRSGMPISMKEKLEMVKNLGNENFVKMLIAWLPLVDSEVVKEIRKWFGGVPLENAEGKLLKWVLENRDSLGEGNWIKSLPAELRALAEEIVMTQPQDELDKRTVERLAVKVIRDLVERRIEELQKKITEAEKQDENEKADNYYREVVVLNKKSSEMGAILA